MTSDEKLNDRRIETVIEILVEALSIALDNTNDPAVVERLHERLEPHGFGAYAQRPIQRHPLTVNIDTGGTER